MGKHITPPRVPPEVQTLRRFNDDLLLNPDRHEEVKRDARLGRVFHLFHNSPLHEVFVPIDERAKKFKGRAQLAGVLAIVSAAIALMITAASPLIGHGAGARWASTIAAVLALVALAIGFFGALRGTRKKTWLLDRLRTERLRQFHFQRFIWDLGKMAQTAGAANPEAAAKELQNDWLKQYLKEEPDEKLGRLFHDILDPAENEVWTPPVKRGDKLQPPPEASSFLDDVFYGYEIFRLNEQISYAAYKLRSPRQDAEAAVNQRRSSVFKFWTRPAGVLEQWLHKSWLWLFGLLMVLHFAIPVVHWIKSRGESHYAATQAFVVHDVEAHEGVSLVQWLDVGVVVLAFAALALHTIGVGLALPREMERYTEYLADVLRLRNEFQAATSPAEKLAIMVRMEEVAFQEMRSFLRAHEEATFTL